MHFKRIFKYIWLAALLLAADGAVNEELNKSDYGFFDDLSFAVSYSVLFVLSVAAVASWSVFYRRTKKKVAFIVFALPLLLFSIILGINIHDNIRKNVPCFLAAGAGTYTLFLRTDSTYRFSDNHDYVGDSYYGNFNMRKDTIYLHNQGPDIGLEYTELVICKGPYDSIYKTASFVTRVGGQAPMIFVGRINEEQHIDTLPYAALPVNLDERQPK